MELHRACKASLFACAYFVFIEMEVELMPAGRILQDIRAANCQGPSHGNVYVPGGLLGMAVPGEGGD